MTSLDSSGAGAWQRATISHVKTETPRVKSFTFELERWRPFRPGQHYDVRLTAPDGYQAQRSYSIASPPEDEGSIENIELRLKRIDGKEFPALVSVQPMRYHDEPAYLTGIIDIPVAIGVTVEIDEYTCNTAFHTAIPDAIVVKIIPNHVPQNHLMEDAKVNRVIDGCTGDVTHNSVAQSTAVARRHRNWKAVCLSAW